VAKDNVNVALVPLGTPLLAGPGAIVATMVFVSGIDGPPDLVAVAAGIVAVHVVMWIVLRYSVLILRLLRDSGITLVTRIAGLLLSAIAVQLIAESVQAFIEGSG
jgi:multiple antibiotic resistance protein